MFFHELGHFLVGRWCGVKVDAFSLGFGPEICHFNDRHGTRWRIGALPLGGYVKFHGDANGASMTDVRRRRDDVQGGSGGQLLRAERRKRAAIVAAGPIANFLLAIVIFTGIFYISGRGMLAPLVDNVTAGSAAEAAGFQPGDLIVSIDGRKIESFEDMQRIVQTSSDTALTFDVDRQGKTVELVATPRRREITTPFGTTRVGVLGVETRGKPENWRVKHYGLVEFVHAGDLRDLVCRCAHGLLSRRPRHRPGIGRPAVRSDPDRRGFRRDGQNRHLRRCSTSPPSCRFRSGF